MLWVFAFEVPRFCETGLKDDSFLESEILSCDFRVMIWKALKRFSGINFRMVSSFFDVLSGKGALIGIRTHLDFRRASFSGGDNWDLCVSLWICVLVCFVCLVCLLGLWDFVWRVWMRSYVLYDGCDRWSTILTTWLIDWVPPQQVSVLNHCLPKYGIKVMYTSRNACSSMV